MHSQERHRGQLPTKTKVDNYNDDHKWYSAAEPYFGILHGNWNENSKWSEKDGYDDLKHAIYTF